MVVLKPTLRAASALALAAFLLSAQTLDELSRQGKELMAQGRYSDAIPVYESLVKAVPGNVGLLQNLAMAEAMSGHTLQAIPHLSKVLESQPESIPALTMLSMARLQMNQPEQALPLLQKLTRLSPADADARGMLAGSEMALHRYHDAAADYERLTKADPSDAKAWYGLGKAHEALATAAFEALNKKAPESAYVAVLVGDSRLQRRQYRSAFFFYKQAEKQMPDLPDVQRGLASVYEKTGHADWAAKEETSKRPYQLAAKRDEASTLYASAKQHNEGARQAFEQLGRLLPSPELYALKAQILHDRGQDLDAAQEWKNAIAVAPPSEQTRLKAELATSYFLGHDYTQAMPLIQEFLVSDAASPDFNFMMGESLWRTQQADKAIPYLERALLRDPDMLPAHAALGLALASLTRYAEATPHLEKAASLDDDGSLHYSLARAYQGLGNAEQARRNMEEYKQIQQRNSEINGELAKEAEITAPPPAR